jgi:hypothetical protein
MPLTDGPPLRASRRNMLLCTLSISGAVTVVLLATQAGCVPQVLPAENWKEPKGVRDRHERAPVMLG